MAALLFFVFFWCCFLFDILFVSGPFVIGRGKAGGLGGGGRMVALWALV